PRHLWRPSDASVEIYHGEFGKEFHNLIRFSNAMSWSHKFIINDRGPFINSARLLDIPSISATTQPFQVPTGRLDCPNVFHHTLTQV
ncbi:hypothetical protein ACHAXS_000910, partial [Conticribra weissflogii]